MKTFKDIKFKQDSIRTGVMRASITLDCYTLSVVYGDTMYGDGPTHDTYEVAVWQKGHDELLPLSSDNDVVGWQNSEEITSLMKILQTEPGFGDCVRVLKRTKYNNRFSNISHMRDQAFA
jgi:hypothetical protein